MHACASAELRLCMQQLHGLLCSALLLKMSLMSLFYSLSVWALSLPTESMLAGQPMHGIIPTSMHGIPQCI